MKTGRSTRVYYLLSLILGITSLILAVTAIVWLIFTIPELALRILAITGLVTAGFAEYFCVRALRALRIFATAPGKTQALLGFAFGLMGAIGSLFCLLFLALGMSIR